MRILVIAGHFAPRGGASSILVTRTVRELTRRGHEVTVFTGPLRRGDSAAAATSPDPSFQVIRPKSHYKPHQQAFYWFWHRVAKSAPDAMWHWARFSISQARKVLESAQPDVIYSRSSPFSSHVLANHLKNHCDVQWVAHFGDPLTGNPYIQMNWFTKRLNARLERRIYDAADALLFENEVQRDLMIGHDFGYLDKAEIIPPFFNPAEIANAAAIDIPKTDSRVLLAHVGSIYGLRSPKGLLKGASLLRQQDGTLANISLVFVGTSGRFQDDDGEFATLDDLVRKYGLNDVVRIVHEVPYEESLEWIATADVAVSIDAPLRGSPFLPSKLIPYAATGKPVLNLTPIGSISEQFTRKVGGISVPPDCPEKIAEALKKLMASQFEQFNEFRPNARMLDDFSISAVHDRLEVIITETMRGRDHRRRLQLELPDHSG